jgi:hypothetical protein
MTVVSEWARYFAITLCVELLVAVPLLGRPERLLRRVAAVTLAQLTTHPGVWFILPELRMGRTPYLIVAESGAVLIEFLFYRLVFSKLPWSRALAVSALANGASLAVGTLLR